MHENAISGLNHTLTHIHNEIILTAAKRLKLLQFFHLLVRVPRTDYGKHSLAMISFVFGVFLL